MAPSAKPQRPVLADHKPKGRTRVPPLMSHGAPLREVSWHAQMLPDFLWLGCMLGRRSDWGSAYRPLEVIDRYVPSGDRFADGRLSTFALVPPERRAEARQALQRETPHALPSVLGDALALYPECPANWLYDSPEPTGAARTRAVALVRNFVEDHRDKYSVRSTRLRMAAFSRRVTHGKVSHPGGYPFNLFPKYPAGLTESEQRVVESSLRAMWMNLFGLEVEAQPSLLDWPRYFWQRSRSLVPCELVVPERIERTEGVTDDQDGPVDPEPALRVSEVVAVLKAVESLGDSLRKVQLELVADADDDSRTSVLLGLASRQYRLLHDFLDRPSAWAPAVANLHLRPLLDARILSAWLIAKSEAELFTAYRDYGMGRLKLLREHLAADLGESADQDYREALEYLDRRVNLERDDWFQPVNLGAFAKKSVRDMAKEAGLEREYNLAYAPFSSETHAEWPTVREHDTTMCTEPLHLGHRVGVFAPSPRVGSMQAPWAAFSYARDGICAIFGFLGRDVRELFEPVEQAIDAALFVPGDDDPTP